MEDKMSESDIFDEKCSASLFSNEKLSTNLSMDITNSDCNDLDILYIVIYVTFNTAIFYCSRFNVYLY